MDGSRQCSMCMREGPTSIFTFRHNTGFLCIDRTACERAFAGQRIASLKADHDFEHAACELARKDAERLRKAMESICCLAAEGPDVDGNAAIVRAILKVATRALEGGK